jgi:predicted nucleotidyltransferase
MNLSKLLSTKEREIVLTDILFKHERISVAEIARKLGVSKGFISRYFSLLKKERILRRVNGDYSVVADPGVKLLKILFSLKPLTRFNFKKYPYVKGAGVYGSSVKGENNEDSDIDIWIKISEGDEADLARLSAVLKKKFGKISPLYLTAEKIETLKREDLPFYHSLVFGSIKLCGEDLV